jgi:hypothetical protein
VLKDVPKVAPPTTKRPSEEIVSGDESTSDVNEGFITDSSNGKTQLQTTTEGIKQFKGRDAAKKALLKEQQSERKVAALDRIANMEETKLKVIADLKLQVKAQNMIAMLNHPTIANNAALSSQMFDRIMAVINSEEQKNNENTDSDVRVDTRNAEAITEAAANEAIAIVDNMNANDDEGEVTLEDDDSDEED